MPDATIRKTTFHFLKQLTANNNRDWFNQHKEDYLQAKENAEQFIDVLIRKMNNHDRLETVSGKKSLYRIYNDVRFSKEVPPYNPRFAGYLARSKPMLRGGYYIWIRPGGSRVGCGFVHPNSDDLKRIRGDIAMNYIEWRQLFKSKGIVNHFGKMTGDQVKTVPRGFSSDHPAIDLLRYKQFWFERTFTDKEVLAAGFLSEVNYSFKSIRPFFNYMSDVLTTDGNGEAM